MWESMLKHPLFRVSVVLLLGLFGLCLLLGMISGGGYMGMGYMGGYGFSFGGMISGLLILLVKLLMIVLAVAILLGFIAWIRSTFFKNSDMQFIKTINKDPLLRTTVVVTIAIFGLMLAGGILSSLMQPYGMGMGMGMRGMGGYGGGSFFGFNPAFGIAGLLAMLIQLLMTLLVISLIAAAVIYIKGQYESGKFKINVTSVIVKEGEAAPDDEMNKIDKTV